MAKADRGKAYIGTSGFHYNHWKKVFYPEKMPTSEWFAYYCKSFDTVEINNTFYQLPPDERFVEWRRSAPENFCYSLKFNRYGSHLKCLKEPESTIGKFIDAAVHLKKNLGPILVQLKPNWKKNFERLNHFLEVAPKNFRWVMEFRNKSWLCAEIFQLLKQHGVALCLHDMLADHPVEVTADFVYMRFHGDHYDGSYSRQFLDEIARKINIYCDQGLDVYVYFNNDAHGYAVENALVLKKLVEE
ncbi:MAG: DUF72 domain-containing protein [Candidatus Rifleibacteriota bacterium]